MPSISIPSMDDETQSNTLIHTAYDCRLCHMSVHIPKDAQGEVWATVAPHFLTPLHQAIQQTPNLNTCKTFLVGKTCDC